ncbi:alpha/beta fold hydrolase [Micrococcus sp. HMSC067E09]|uniref:alpha/beta fold hydrolase n=1 Tax=Micrococcus sp. HMSC067E09 TaxID=1739367 RepID=UPI001AEFF5BA|nr:alpha/beta hydrolase [Micrococcus sp. HMSC067E09]
MIERDGVSLRVLDTGVPAGAGPVPCLLLLHGLGGCALEWTGVAGRLAEDARVVAFDARGHGGSTRRPEDLSRAAHVADVAAVVEDLALGPVVLVGQSCGGHTALMAAATRPDLVTRLVLVEGGVGGEGAEHTAPVSDWFRAWPQPFADRRAAVDFLGGGPAAEAWADGLEATAEGLRGRWDADVLHEVLLAVHTQDRWDECRSVTAPTLLVRGGEGSQPAAEFDAMLEANRHAEGVVVPGAGHDVHLDAPDAVAEAIFPRREKS